MLENIKKKISPRELYITLERNVQKISTFTEIRDAFFIASFSLTCIKFLIGFLPIYINFSLLFIFTLYAYVFHYYIQFQYLFALFLRKIMPQHLFEARDDIIDSFIGEWEGSPNMQKFWEDLKKVTISQQLSFIVFFYMVKFRLFFLSKPLFSSFIYFFILVFLLFNKLPIYILAY